MFRSFVWMLGCLFALATSIATSHQAEAWGHCHWHRHDVSNLWGGYGMGGGFYRSYYPTCLSYGTSFYGGFTNCWPQYTSAYYCPPVYSSYNLPQVYPSYYSSPVLYRPVIRPTIVLPRLHYRPWIFPIVRRPLCITTPAVAAPTVALSKAPWLNSAVELIDQMVQQGGVEEGLQACEQLIRVRDQLPSEIYWRAAVLAAVQGRDSRDVVAFIDSAEKAGDRFGASQLPGGSLRAYLRTANASTLDDSLNRLATTAMKSANPISDYRALSALLALDGQSDRARLFTLAASKAVPFSSESTSIAHLASLE